MVILDEELLYLSLARCSKPLNLLFIYQPVDVSYNMVKGREVDLTLQDADLTYRRLRCASTWEYRNERGDRINNA